MINNSITDTGINENHMYDDILHMKHHRSEKRPHMSITDRAAQFSSFSALTGYDEVIKETGEQVTEKMKLGENEKYIPEA